MKKRRDLRVKVTMPATLRIQDGRRVKVRVDDVSANGLLVSTDEPPAERGSFVEVLCRGRSIAAQVRWNKDGRSGLALAQSIDIAAAARGEGLVANQKPAFDNDCRRDHSLRAMLDIAQSAENSRRMSRAMQFVFAVAMIVGSAAIVAHGVSSTLSAGLNPVQQALSKRDGDSATSGQRALPPRDGGYASRAALR